LPAVLQWFMRPTQSPVLR